MPYPPHFICLVVSTSGTAVTCHSREGGNPEPDPATAQAKFPPAFSKDRMPVCTGMTKPNLNPTGMIANAPRLQIKI
jgi:hypothetical protein